MITFSKRLSQLQSENKFLKKDIAKAVNISIMAYYRYEKSERHPTLPLLIALADFFDVSLDYLVGRTDNPDSHKN